MYGLGEFLVPVLFLLVSPDPGVRQQQIDPGRVPSANEFDGLAVLDDLFILGQAGKGTMHRGGHHPGISLEPIAQHGSETVGHRDNLTRGCCLSDKSCRTCTGRGHPNCWRRRRMRNREPGRCGRLLRSLGLDLGAGLIDGTVVEGMAYRDVRGIVLRGRGGEGVKG